MERRAPPAAVRRRRHHDRRRRRAAAPLRVRRASLPVARRGVPFAEPDPPRLWGAARAAVVGSRSPAPFPPRREGGHRPLRSRRVESAPAPADGGPRVRRPVRDLRPPADGRGPVHPLRDRPLRPQRPPRALLGGGQAVRGGRRRGPRHRAPRSRARGSTPAVLRDRRSGRGWSPADAAELHRRPGDGGCPHRRDRGLGRAQRRPEPSCRRARGRDQRGRGGGLPSLGRPAGGSARARRRGVPRCGAEPRRDRIPLRPSDGSRVPLGDRCGGGPRARRVGRAGAEGSAPSSGS